MLSAAAVIIVVVVVVFIISGSHMASYWESQGYNARLFLFLVLSSMAMW